MIQSILNFCIALLLIAGIAVTQFYVVGFEFHRFFTPSWFYLGAAILIPFSVPLTVNKSAFWVYACLMVLALYLGVRGLVSELPLLAGKDFSVFFYGLVTFLGMMAIAKNIKSFLVVVVVALSLFLYQISLSLLPNDIAEGLPRAWGELANSKEGHGLFRHYNPFASYCGLSMAVITGLFFVKLRNKSLQPIIQITCVVLALLTGFAVLQSGSRLGAGVTFSTLILGVFLALAVKFTFHQGSLRSKGRLMLMVVTLITGSLVSLVGGAKIFNYVSESRGRSGNLGEDVMGGMRVSTISMGFALWHESPLVGSGPRSYWLHAPRLRESQDMLTKRFSDPEMVHNDYVQTLAEYGLAGLALVLLTISSILYAIWRVAYMQRFISENWVLPPLIATASVMGIMVHALADFTIHIAPVFVQLSLILGGCYGYLLKNHVSTQKYSRRIAGIIYLFRGVALFSGAGCFIASGKNQIVHVIDLVKYDYAKWHGSETNYLYEAQRVSELAPEPILFENLGVQLLRRTNTLTNQQERMEALLGARSNFEKALVLNPYRITTIANLAMIELELENFEKVEEYLILAFQLSNYRWRAHGVAGVAVMYLVKQGELLWYEERRAPEAMSYFLEASYYLKEGKSFGKGPYDIQLRKYYRNKIKEYLTVLEAGQIESNSEIKFFDGKGAIR